MQIKTLLETMFKIDILTHSLQITALVFIMMVLVDWIDVRSRGKVRDWVTGKKFREYLISSFFGATPGCTGAFLNVSLYMHGFISFGALVGSMIATSGDEAFVMFAEFPLTAFYLTLLLFVLGIALGFITDFIVERLKIQTCEECEAHAYHPNLEGSLKHYLIEHLWNHIIKKHLLRIFLWTFFTLWAIHLGTEYLNVQEFVRHNPHWMILFAALMGIIPESGPHLIFVMLFSQGTIPFSVLLTSSMVQDGHGMLPLLSYSVKDSILVKLFNVLYGLIIGYFVLLLGY